MWQGITILMGKDGMSMVGREEIDGKERPSMAFDSMSQPGLRALSQVALNTVRKGDIRQNGLPRRHITVRLMEASLAIRTMPEVLN